MATWKVTMDQMLHVKTQTTDFKFELLNYLYGYIGWCIGNERKPEARKYLDIAENMALELEQKKQNLSLVNAYQGAFNGYNIALAPYKVIFFGSRSIKHVEKAIQLDKKNYFGYLQMGNIEYYKPPRFGGDKYKSINYYGQAKALIENDYFKSKNDWNYLNILVSIAKSYTALGKYEEAKKYYEATLKIEPQFTWVKNNLLPELNKKMKDGK
ncbi:MAG TPA: tetratricopeptide repeat protein [Bacteroidales bacterium]|nr:tetratricopeptide repeat protein [Bacteroidales bacterium]